MRNSSREEDTFAADAHEKEFIVVAVVDDLDLASNYKQLLEDNDIPTELKVSDEADEDPSISVVVPEECLDEAHIVIESENIYEDYFDMTLDDDLDDYSDVADEDY